MKITIILIAILLAGTVTTNFTFERVKKPGTPDARPTVDQPGQFSPAFANLTAYTATAFLAGFNSSTMLGNCAPSGTATCNPGFAMYRGVTTTFKIIWGDCCTHTFSLYTKGFLSTKVNTTDSCSTANKIGCVAKANIPTSRTVNFLFAPNIPLDDFTGLGGYEYYCQIHPDSMHGKVIVYKNPNISGTGVVNILDASALAVSFDSTHGSANFNAAVDFNNDGVIDILDASFLANLFDRPI
ncbi:MAG TPA: dockerin type I domain-containing protein [Candidatus Bathyarchaeia archaeon]|nr:dockerin type I domain-containing protein [Candidatus Bathyarchaeia archaeon]